MTMKTLYLAYGANLNLRGMVNRCPSAIPVKPVALKGWKLVFRGVADIIKTNDPNDILNAAIWQITEKCERSLDSFEGYPILYRKSYIETDEDSFFEGNRIMFYTMNDSDISSPSTFYYQTIKEGYAAWNLDVACLDKALDEAGSLRQVKTVTYNYAPQPSVYNWNPAASRRVINTNNVDFYEDYDDWLDAKTSSPASALYDDIQEFDDLDDHISRFDEIDEIFFQADIENWTNRMIEDELEIFFKVNGESFRTYAESQLKTRPDTE